MYEHTVIYVYTRRSKLFNHNLIQLLLITIGRKWKFCPDAATNWTAAM